MSSPGEFWRGVKRGRESFDTGFVCALSIGGLAMNIRYRVALNQEERDQPARMRSGDRRAARKPTKAGADPASTPIR